MKNNNMFYFFDINKGKEIAKQGRKLLKKNIKHMKKTYIAPAVELVTIDSTTELCATSDREVHKDEYHHHHHHRHPFDEDYQDEDDRHNLWH